MQHYSNRRFSLQQMKRRHYALFFMSFAASLVRISGLTLFVAALGFWVWFQMLIPFDATAAGAFINAALNGACIVLTGEAMGWSFKQMRRQLERLAREA